MRDELVSFAQDTGMKFERSRHDTFSNMEEKDKTLSDDNANRRRTDRKDK